MKFLEVPHPDGGRIVVHIDHITTAHFRPGEGDKKSRLGFDLDQSENDLVVFGEEAERAWQTLQKLVAPHPSE